MIWIYGNNSTLHSRSFHQLLKSLFYLFWFKLNSDSGNGPPSRKMELQMSAKTIAIH